MEQSPKLGLSIDTIDVKYISGLSTILVASIQDAKDKISQIEYIFCSQLYPNFQTNGLEKIYAEAKKGAEDAWKKKENEFNLRLEKFELEKKQVVEENSFLVLEKEKLQKEQEEKMGQLVGKIEQLKGELMWKSKETDDRMELNNNLVQLVQAKTSVIANKDKELKEHEEKTNVLLSDLNNLRKKVELLEQELREKTQEVADGKKLAENLFKKVESQSFDIMHNEEQLINCNKEKKLLEANFQKLKVNYEKLHVALGKKKDEVEQGRKMQLLEEHEETKELLLAKLKGLEQEVNELRAAKLNKSGDDADHVNEERESYELLKQIESKAAELMAEKKKKRDLLDAYKRLKSQYNYLCRKSGLTTENMSFPNKLEDESDSARHHHSPKPSLDAENRNLNTTMVVFDTKSLKDVTGVNGDLGDENGAKSVEGPSSRLPTSSLSSRKCPSSVKSNPMVGTKRPGSGWRDTRSHQGQARHDPHDDFLDTPLENIRGNLEKSMKKEACNPPVPEDMNVDSSDDETHDVSVDKRLRKQEIPLQMADKGSFKYVEPVRKKAEREKLKGFECNQCKKFYDAVIDKGDQGNEDPKKNFRCEHHDGVSRHRYKYVPPLTPEGFWNIGFESEM
ncbi:Gamma response protein 1, putative isoform 2 [Hibiscus syriacus]|uniref:Gamma response protein 1, putative isoform 2 n=1 Tax=Hibiscus syriacus TaxID=106335 RepID=A0A6A3D0B1_HIBSY|nr:protein gamma response 1-like [Hibiscus syriacus]KAE8732779.1 Gamma response protein 1, putative isoform 2 [Hibiscus syriacus]